MGNRAVLCLKDDNTEGFDENEVGIYLHWHGYSDTVESFLSKAKEVMQDRVSDASYTKARLIQVIGNEIPGNLSMGVGICKYLDYESDNGAYIIDCSTLTIIGREQ